MTRQIVAAMCALSWLGFYAAGCVPDDDGSPAGDGWELSDAGGSGSWAPGSEQDAGWSNDSPDDNGLADMRSWLRRDEGPGADFGVSSAADLGGAPEGDAAMGGEPLERQVIGRWVGVVPLQILPRTTGVVVALEFDAAGTISVSSSGVREGAWQVLPNRRLYLSGLQLEQPQILDTMLLKAEVEDGTLRGLVWSLDGKRTVRFERPGAGSGLSLSSLQGRWQSKAPVAVGAESLYLGIEVSAGGTIAYGHVSAEGELVPSISHLGAVLTSSLGEHFWLLQPPTFSEGDFPVSGEVMLDATGAPAAVYAPFKLEGGVGGRDVFQSVELVPVGSYGAP